MRFLLDANAVIGLLGGNAGVLAGVRRHSPQDFGIPAVVAHELYYGAYRSAKQAQNLALLDNLRLEVLGFDKEDAQAAGKVRAMLAASGTPIGPYDVLIAGQALARGLVLVTHNVGEFSRVAGLQVEDWEG